VNIPTIETERLVLRPPVLADLPSSLSLWSDPEVVRFIGGVPATEEDVWGRLQRYVGHWHLLGFGMFVVCDKAGNYLGEIGFLDARRGMEPKLDAPEVGWVLRPSAHGQGIASEAVRALLAWGEVNIPVAQSFMCIIDPGNAPSIRVAEKMGFREIARTTYKNSPTIVFRRSRPNR
jgi:RimJ/RimL family protein N-acetyltransferase